MKIKKEIILLLVLLYGICFFNLYINSIFIMILSATVFFRIYRINRKVKNSVIDTVLLLAIISIPISFTNIYGGSYGDLPVSWFNIYSLWIIILAFMNTLKSGKINKPGLTFLGFSLLICGIILILISNNYVDAFNQYLNFCLFIGLAISGCRFSFGSSITKSVNMLKTYFIYTIILSALFLFLQFILYKFLSLKVGFIGEFGSNRVALGFLFSDFSFFSLYLCVGAVLLLQKEQKRMLDYLYILIVIAASVVTSARTGIAALAVMYAFIIFKGILLVKKRAFLNVIIISVLIAAASYYLVIIRGGQGLLDSSGRIDLYLQSLEVFLDHPFLGVGLGVMSFLDQYKIGIPHNFIIQLLAQTGLFYTLMMVTFVILILKDARKVKSVFYLPSILILVGAMLIPDILHSRFFAIIAFLIQYEKHNISLKDKV